MRRILLLAVLFAALGTTTSSAQYSSRDGVARRVIEPGVYQDGRGTYQWQTVERRVWIPERRTAGIFGIGSRRIPGHYEIRTDRVKVYRNNQYGSKRKGWEGKHPHGMPPGQRKKLENRRYDDRRYDDRRYDDRRYDRDDRYDRNDSRKGKNAKDRRD
jgi:hypothetical protein